MRNVPDTMRAAAIDRFGPPTALSIHELPVPKMAPNEVLIAVDTSGVGRWDADVRGGWYPKGKPRFPLVLGTDGSGTIAAIGSRVRRFEIGDRVHAYRFENVFEKGGFYAEFVAIAATNVARIPRGLDLEHAGAMTVTGLTALQGVDDALHVESGETLLIHGATGAVGTLAIQFAKRRGARVFASASGKAGVALARRLGAEAAVDGRRADVADALGRFAPDGVDAVLALAGGKALTRCLDRLRRGGRLAYPSGVEPAPRQRRGMRVISYDAVAGVREFARMRKAVDEARLEVPIAASYALAEAARAHERVEKGHVPGKVLLRIR